MSQTLPVEPAPFRNRRAGLILFGIVQIGLGVLAALMAGFMAVSILMLNTGAEAAQLRMTAPVTSLYLFGAAFLITLGVGSIRARRWAWALTLASSWIWLVTGLLSSISVVAIMPQVFRGLPADQQGVQTFMIGCMAIFFGLFFIALPIAFVLFYRSRNVRATVEALDPVARWTDRVPMSVLAYSIMMFFAAASILVWAFVYRALPIGPWMIRGVAVPAVMLAFSALCLFIAVGFARLLRSAWWTALAMFLVGAVYSAVFFFQIDFKVWYEAMDLPYDQQQIELLTAMYSNPFFLGSMFGVWVVYFAWLFYTRRFFYPRAAMSH